MYIHIYVCMYMHVYVYMHACVCTYLRTGGSSVSAQVQVRADVNDPNGFSWVTASLMLLSENKIFITAFWSSDVATGGTFYKHKVY